MSNLTIEIDGVGRVQLDDSFRSLTPDQQEQTIQEIVRQRGQGGQPDSSLPTPEPPPGVVIHEAEDRGGDTVTRSRVTGRDDLAVDTSGMSPEQQQTAVRALEARRRGAEGEGNMASRAARAISPQLLSPFFQGQSLSWGDEAVSGLYGAASALTGGGFDRGYDFAQEYQRQELDQARKDAPIGSTVAQVAGGLANAPLLAAGAPAATSMPLYQQMGAGAALGAGYGAVEGAGAAESDERGTGAMWGGMAGTAFGGLAPAVGRGVKAGAQRVMDSATVNRGLQRIGLSRPAGDTLMRALDADDAFSGSGAANLQRAGDSAMLAEAGPTARSVLDTAMQRGGPATRIAREAVERRAAAANRRVTSALNEAFGRPQGIATATGEIREGARRTLPRIYQRAYDTPIDYSTSQGQELQGLLNRVPARALSEARELMQLGGHQSRQILADVAEDGTVRFSQLPDVMQLDYITRALNQLARSGDGQGALGGQTPKGAALESLSRDIRGGLRKLVPQYARALDTAADPIQEIAAMRLGKKLLSSGMARDEVRQSLRGMSAAERRGVKQGLRSQIDEVIANTRMMVSDPNIEAREAMKGLNDLSSRAVREKIEAVVPPAQAKKFFEQLDEARTALELRAAVARNSATYGRTAVDDAVKRTSEPGVVGSLAEMKPAQATQRAVQTFTGRTPADQVARQDGVYRELAEVLTQPQGENARNALAELMRAYERAPANVRRAMEIGDFSAAGLLTGGTPQGRQFLE